MTKTVLITGCSSGFGKTATGYFVRQGWNVIATMRNISDGKELAELDNVLVTRLDVEDPASIASAIEAGIERFGRIDALVNNAGYGLFGIFEATSPEKIKEQFDVNVFGVMSVTRAILPHFRTNKAGVIINVSSGAGVFTLPMISLYCASKFALEGFSEALSYELSGLGITVKVVEPGGVISTKFGQRSGAEAGQAQSIPDYEPFVTSSLAIFETMRGQRLATEEDVAKVIHDAVTDGTDQLRYVATDDIKPLVRARRETSEAEYIQFMRSKFGASAAS
ncbi:SDR family oxidoreductase [Phyllobacterium sp. YR531]|uniref:SDR family oxidoreductase n=1 Tax=Phyllobacterium sp. YR531 TaxID=1144343 RepID=UPI00026F5206|nr:SDR family oxidoreductase [Phyllobacterium sp. YR531]EJN06531.1 short-chain alcohol dehydrogenase [Phyllobacterium sp. YR531]